MIQFSSTIEQIKKNNQGPDTQKHLSPTYLSAVYVTAVKTTYFIERVYSKLRLSWTLT